MKIKYMNFKNVVLFYFLVIFFISPIDILGEKLLNYKETEPGGNFGNNRKRKLEVHNYIIVKYYIKTQYTIFEATNRKGISYIINEGTRYNLTDSFTIQANNSIEMHFSSPVKSLYGFFSMDNDRNVENIVSIDLSHFDSSLLENIGYMFNGCNHLKSVDLSHFDTSLVTNMERMFYGNEQLKSLNLSNFNTSLVTNMYGMFYNCNQLESLNLPNFDTSLVTNMYGMFYNCTQLKSLDISNFNTTSVINSSLMFDGLNSINFINLYNVKDNNQLKSVLSQFLNNNTNHNIIICQRQ